jgi:hypothetical protein
MRTKRVFDERESMVEERPTYIQHIRFWENSLTFTPIIISDLIRRETLALFQYSPVSIYIRYNFV